MMAGYRQLHTRMWSSDRWFADLKPDYKLLFIYLFSNERASVCGLYELPLRVISFETGLGQDVIVSGFAEFSKDNKAHYDDETGVVLVTNMFKYQGSGSPKLVERIKADLKAVPKCALKERWISENRVLIGYGRGKDTSLSISSSISSSVSVSVSEEGEGMGEETIPIPETPRQAAEHPDIQLFESVSGRFPGSRDYVNVIDAIQFLRSKHGDKLKDYLTPFWTAWSTRKTKDNKPYSPSSLVWLSEWAMQGDIPRANGHEPKKGETKVNNQDVIRKVAQNAR